jgi:hypothetical protein
MLELDGAWFVQASYGETGWVADLRAAGEATVTHPGGRRVPVQAVELSPEEAGLSFDAHSSGPHKGPVKGPLCAWVNAIGRKPQDAGHAARADYHILWVVWYRIPDSNR